MNLSTNANKDKAGTYTITPSWNNNPNYSAQLIDGKYTVGKKPAPPKTTTKKTTKKTTKTTKRVTKTTKKTTKKTTTKKTTAKKTTTRKTTKATKKTTKKTTTKKTTRKTTKTTKVERRTEPTSVRSAGKAAAKTSIDAGLRGTSSDSAVTAVWGKVDGATGYDVYAAYCGKNSKFRKFMTVSGSTQQIAIKKMNGKQLNNKKNVKYYVVAFKTVKGKKVKLATSISVHVVGSQNAKLTNVKSIKVKKSIYTLSKGKTAKIRAKLTYEKKNKKRLKHVSKFRYATTNAKVATVSKKGKITAVGKGKCTIYVYAHNGLAKKITVKVR